MLAGFFKIHEDSDCSCRVIKYSDRIWLLNDRGDAQFRRQFIIEVLRESKAPLTSVRVAIPTENITELDVINDECFNEELIFNSPHTLTTENYEVLNKPKNQRDFGIIEDDGIDQVKVFGDIVSGLSKTGLGTPDICNVVKLPFPSPIGPGEKVEIRITFKVSAMFDVVNPNSKFPTNAIRLNYFTPCYKDLAEYVGRSNEIKVLPELDPTNTNHPGGFDIWLYFLPNYEKIGGFLNTSLEVYDEVHNFDGLVGEKRIKLCWRLRNLSVAKDNKLIGSGDFFSVNGQLAEVYDSKTVIDKIKEDIPTIRDEVVKGIAETKKRLERNSRLGLILSIVAMVLSIVLPFIIPLIKAAFNSR